MKWILLASFPLLASCQISYLLKSARGQLNLLNSGESIEESLKDPQVTEEQKSQIRLAMEAKQFAEDKIGLKKTKNYSTFVNLDRRAASFVVSAAPKWELKHHLWYFPIVGNVPYKGYFDENDAKAEAEELKKQDFDTYMRGVTAYSTLGWFKDPLLSSMTKMKSYDLVNTIIHETVHATIYIKSSADFNERLASFIGDEATEVFYTDKEGADSPTVKRIRLENKDQHLFSDFISKEIQDLKTWYQENKTHDEAERRTRIKKIQENFQTALKPKLKTDLYDKFPEIELNNARLMLYKTYQSDMTDFSAVFEKVNRSFSEMIKIAKHLEKTKKPDEELKRISTLSPGEIAELVKAR